MKEIGAEGQSRIAASRVFVIGAGGVGCPAALALVESGIASLTIADADAVDLSNLPRQILHTPDRIGMNKAQSAAIALRTVNPAVPVNVVTDYVDEENSRLLPETATSSLMLRIISARVTPPTARPKC